MEITLQRQLLKSHLHIIVFCSSVIMMAILAINLLHAPIEMTEKVHVPNAQAAMTAQLGLHRSSAALSGWLALRDENLRLIRNSSWENEVMPALESLKASQIRTGHNDSLLLSELETKLNRLRRLQDWIEDVGNKPGNEPARLVFIKELQPKTISIDGKLVELLAIIEGRPRDIKDRYNSDITSLRFSLISINAALGRFVIDRNSKDEEIYDSMSSRFKKILENIERNMMSKLDQHNLDIIHSVRNDFREYDSLADSIISSRKSPRSNVAWNTIETKSKPLKNEIAALLGTIASNESSSVRTIMAKIVSWTDTIAFSLLAMLLITTGIAIYLSYRGANRIAAPITQLSLATENIAQGDFYKNVEENDIVEVRSLIRAFNKMQESIKVSHIGLEKMAFTDDLTGLRNRKSFYDQLEKTVEKTSRRENFSAIIVIDLDYFKEVNDGLGHDAGDYLLKLFAVRLKSCIRSDDVAARIGGDEFSVLLRTLASISDAEQVIQKIQKATTEPMYYRDQRVTPSCTIGAVISKIDCMDIEKSLKNADLALYEAKQHQRGTFKFYSDKMRDGIMRAREISDIVRKNPVEDVFSIYFQPYFDFNTGEIAGFEALLRWIHPDCENGSTPDEFIPILEHSKAIEEVSAWVVSESCRKLHRWQNISGNYKLTMSVNISAILLHKETLVELTQGALSQSQVNAENLIMEITESVAMEDPSYCLDTMNELKKIGVQFAIDDFGTGHSSLLYLKLMPLSVLKIDRAFVANMLTDKNDATIVEATVHIAQSMGFSVTAEGVEKMEQANRLKELGCSYAQGYLYARPMAAEDIDGLLVDTKGTLNASS